MSFLMDFLFLLVVNVIVDTLLWYPGASIVQVVSSKRLKPGVRKIEKSRSDSIERVDLFTYRIDGQLYVRSYYVASVGLILVLVLALLAYGLIMSTLGR